MQLRQFLKSQKVNVNLKVCILKNTLFFAPAATMQKLVTATFFVLNTQLSFLYYSVVRCVKQ